MPTRPIFGKPPLMSRAEWIDALCDLLPEFAAQTRAAALRGTKGG